MSTQLFADLAHTSQPTVSMYESGKKEPRFDTAERLLKTLHRQLIAVRLNPDPVAIAADEIERLSADRLKGEQHIQLTRNELVYLVDLDAALTGLNLSFGVIKTRVEGITSDRGSAYDLYQLDELLSSIESALDDASGGDMSRPLSLMCRDTLVEQHTHLPEVVSELDFFVRAVAHKGDPIVARHLMNARRIALGYPWLYVRYPDIERHQQGIVAAVRTGNSVPLLSSLTPLQDRD